MTPTKRITDPTREWVSSYRTDIRATWAKYAPHVVAQMRPAAPAAMPANTIHVAPKDLKQ